MSTTTEQERGVRENRLRRVADRQGLKLEKSRRQDPRAVDYGLWRIRSRSTGKILAGGSPHRFSLTLDQVADRLGTGRFTLDEVAPDEREIIEADTGDYFATIVRSQRDGRWVVLDDVSAPLVDGRFPDLMAAFRAFLDDEEGRV